MIIDYEIIRSDDPERVQERVVMFLTHPSETWELHGGLVISSYAYCGPDGESFSSTTFAQALIRVG